MCKTNEIKIAQAEPEGRATVETSTLVPTSHHHHSLPTSCVPSHLQDTSSVKPFWIDASESPLWQVYIFSLESFLL